MPFQLIHGDITKIQADAIVNAANPDLQHGGGVCGAIFAAAGAALQAACNEIGGCETGQAVITPGFALPARYVIHTVGPIWRGGATGEEALLYACYQNSLALAKATGLESIAFPLISAGIYGYPKAQALQIAAAAITDFLRENEMTVSLALFDDPAFLQREAHHAALRAFLESCDAGLRMESSVLMASSFEEERPQPTMRRKAMPLPPTAPREAVPDDTAALSQRLRQAPMPLPPAALQETMTSAADAFWPRLNDIMSHLDERFSQRLFRLTDEKGLSDSAVYKRANLDRRLFSKIRSNAEYRPSKNTALALAVALELSLDDTRDLLRSAGFALSRSDRQDVIVEYFIGEKKYDIFEINEALFAFGQSLLGA